MSNLRNNYAGVRQSFCEKNFVFAGREARWADVTCMVQMSKGRVARIDLSDLGYTDHYAHLSVDIIHPTNGRIDHKAFQFMDYLDERSDTRTDHPDIKPYVWSNNGKFDWYIAVPSKAAIKKLTDAVVAYIKAFE